jgi:hypothetical protein
MDAYDIIARALNQFGRAALVVLALYLAWATIGDRPFVTAAVRHASAYVAHVLAATDADSRLSEADDLRDLSRRSRRLAETIPSDSDRRQLTAYADAMDETARRIEKDASNARRAKLAVQ